MATAYLALCIYKIYFEYFSIETKLFSHYLRYKTSRHEGTTLTRGKIISNLLVLYFVFIVLIYTILIWNLINISVFNLIWKSKGYNFIIHHLLNDLVNYCCTFLVKYCSSNETVSCWDNFTKTIIYTTNFQVKNFLHVICFPNSDHKSNLILLNFLQLIFW